MFANHFPLARKTIFMYVLSLLYSVSLIGASRATYESLAPAATRFLESPDRLEQLLKLKGLNPDGSKLETSEYVSYMAHLLRTKSRPVGWTVRPLEYFIHRILDLKPLVTAEGKTMGNDFYVYHTKCGTTEFTLPVGRYKAAGGASALELGFIRDVVGGALSLARDLNEIDLDSAKSSSIIAKVLSEGGSYHRLAFFIDYFAHLIAQVTYVDYQLMMQVYSASERWVSHHQTEVDVKPGAIIRWIRADDQTRAPNWTAYALSVLWKSRFTNPGLFYKVPEMYRFFRKFEELMAFRGPAYIDLYADLIGMFMRIAPLLAESCAVVNPNEVFIPVAESTEAESEDVGLADFAGLFRKMEIAPPAVDPVAASAFNAAAQERLFADITASRMFDSPWNTHRLRKIIAEGVAQIQILYRLAQVTRNKSDSEFEATWLAELLEASDLDVDAVTAIVRAAPETSALVEFREAIGRVYRVARDAEISDRRWLLLQIALRKCQFAALAGLPREAVKYAKKLTDIITSSKVWQLLPELFHYMTGLFQTLPEPQRFVEVVDLPFTASAIFVDEREARGFENFKTTLMTLRKDITVPLHNCIFKDMGDIALMAGVGYKDRAIDAVSYLRSEAVETEIHAYSLFGMHLPTMKDMFPKIVRDAGKYYRRLREGDLDAVMAEVAGIFEAKQMVRLTFEAMQGVDLEQSKKLASMARYIFRTFSDFASVTIEPPMPVLSLVHNWELTHIDLMETHVDGGVVRIEETRLKDHPSFWGWLLRNPAYVGVLGNLLSLIIEGLPVEKRYLPLLCIGLSYNVRQFGDGVVSVSLPEAMRVLNVYIEGQMQRSAQLEEMHRAPVGEKMERALEDDTSPDTVMAPPGY